MNRRDFLAASAALAAALRAGGRAAARPSRARRRRASSSGSAAGWGRSTRSTRRRRAINKGTPKKAGSLYDSIPTAVRGVRVCEHLPRTAEADGPRHRRPHRQPQGHRRARLRHQPRPHRPRDERQRRRTRRSGRSSPTSAAPRPGRAAVHAHRLPERQPRAGLPRLEGRLRVPHRHRPPARPGSPAPPTWTTKRAAERRRLLEAAGGARAAGSAVGRVRGGPGRGAAAGRAGVPQALRPHDRAGDAPRALRRRVRPAVPARPAAGRGRACGSSRCRTT